MKYKNATAVLPEELIERLQEYVQGEYVYIPQKKGAHKNWGEVSGLRKEIDNRNQEIISAHVSGLSVEEIADKFFLSVYAIRKIVYKR